MTAKQITSYAIGPIAGAGVSFMSLMLMTRYFSVEAIGKLSLLQASVSFCIMLITLGLHQAYVREYHEEKQKGNLLFTTVAIPLLLSIVLAGTLALFSPIISTVLFETKTTLPVYLMSIGIVAGTVVHFYTYVLRMQERGVAYSLSRFLPKLLLFILLGIGVLLHFVEYSFLLIAQISSVLVSLFVFTVLLKTSLVETLYSTVDAVLLKKLFRYSLPLMAADFAYWGLTTSDRFLLRYLAGFEELGFYSVAVLFSGAAFVLTGIFSTIWHPQVYKWAQDETKSHELSSFFEPAAAAIFFIWSCTGLLLKPVLLLLPEKYNAIEPLILLNLSVPLLFVLSETTVIGIHLRRKSFWSMLASFVAFGLNGLLNLVFIPKFGALGASAASAVAFYVFFVMRTEASARIWISFPRLKLHVLGLLFPLVALFQTVMILASLTKLFLWSLLLLITIILFRDQWKQWIMLILKRF